LEQTEFYHLIEEYQRLLDDYSRGLAEELRPKETTESSAIMARWSLEDGIEAQRRFIEDPFRNMLIRLISEIYGLGTQRTIVIHEKETPIHPGRPIQHADVGR